MRFDEPSRSILPVVLEPKWIGREFLGPTLSFIKDVANTPRIDKAIFILMYLASNVTTEITLESLEELLPHALEEDEPDSRWTLIQAMQSIATATTVCSDPQLRFLGYTLLSRFLDMCADDAKVYVLSELLERCPWSAMRAASVGLLKEQVQRAFDDPDLHILKTPLLVMKILPIIYKAETKSLFWHNYSFHMQALNFYLYVLIRDRQTNMTKVWDKPVLEVIQTNYFDPLKEVAEAIKHEAHEKEKQLNKGQGVPEGEENPIVMAMRVEILQNVIESIQHQWNLMEAERKESDSS
ncbi:hypothetical protein BCR43DRAFT_483921 [Syncephalastrum racemosum]|uniref:YAP-binding/ALF4/Glomulin n=1 Tax=Syncephalastrum racemosum TaxID=13706 RepID=A0A1X2HW34_SYNRA|nr:hypothetical protein BCR43DRAFT_483921 [Syncephalastrum racemosum]